MLKPDADTLIAAMKVAADKLIASGMTKEEMEAYISNNSDKILIWCVKLIEEAYSRGIVK